MKIKNNLILFIAGSLLIAFVLVSASLWLYDHDGTIQLDLSRPSLQEAREAQKRAKLEAEKNKSLEKEEEFSAQGDLSAKELSRFEAIYQKTKGEIHSNEFNEDPLSDEKLNITD